MFNRKKDNWLAINKQFFENKTLGNYKNQKVEISFFSLVKKKDNERNS
jgi:hypothetical protein